MKKKSFVIHIDSLNILDDLTNDQAGILFKAIKAYQNDQKIELDTLTKIAFSPFKSQFKRDNEKYKDVCKQRAIAGSKGGKQKVVNANNCKQTVANLADNKSDNKSDSENVFIKPSVKDVYTYMLSRNVDNLSEAEKFIDFYQSKDWLIGTSNMKSWKPAVNNWLKNLKQQQSISEQPTNRLNSLFNQLEENRVLSISAFPKEDIHLIVNAAKQGLLTQKQKLIFTNCIDHKSYMNELINE